MKRNLAIAFALIGWGAVVVQFVLMTGNSTNSIAETIIRFFSFFTILTNMLVALYLTFMATSTDNGPAWIQTPGTLTAITSYIFIVGAVYQIMLRHIWEPKGVQMIVDELLHTIMPLLTVVYWYLFESMSLLSYRMIYKWLIYPLLYLIFILIRGHFSGFYPYYFVDVSKLGIGQTMLTSAILLLVFLTVSALFIFIGRSVLKKSELSSKG